MSSKPGKKIDDFKSWLDGKDYWERILWHLHLTKGAASKEDVQKCYQYVLEDVGVGNVTARTTINFPEFEFDSAEAQSDKVFLEKIEKLQNVNALDGSSVFEFGKNLTIIYGDNGSGKSGIGRLLSNACHSRKPRELLPNIKAGAFGVAMADFHISENGTPKVINYTYGDYHNVLKRFSVFDHECAPVHLNEQNKIEFIPAKLKIFDDVFKSISEVEKLFEEEIRIKQKENPVEGLFADSSKITVFLNSLSAATTNEQIVGTLDFVDADKKTLEASRASLVAKQAQDVSKMKKELLEECSDLNSFKKSLEGKILTASRAAKINQVISEIRNKKRIVEKLSVKNFDFAAFKHIGSPEWRALITAAHKLHEKETDSNDAREPEYCLLCHQHLDAPQKTLFNDYWQFLKSTAEKELETARQRLKALLQECVTDVATWPSFPATESAVKILSKECPTDLDNLKQSFSNQEKQLVEWIEGIKKEEDVLFTEVKTDFGFVEALVLTRQNAEQKIIDPAAEIKSLKDEIRTLEHKELACGLIPKIMDYVSWLAWQKATSAISLSKSKTSITRKKTELVDQLVISKYATLFNDETKKLDCDFGLEVKPRGRSGETVKELRLNFAGGYNPGDILSEGEQTVSALVDFLVEVNLQPKNSGIIFDDPVSSLDHLRKPIIAERLVEESKKRQVIILTHDIMFLADLEYYATRENVDCNTYCMRKIENQSGLIKKELPWIAQNVKDRVGYLRNQLPALKKLENGDQDEYRFKVKSWYGLLYEGWERAIEERIFNKVIQRFSREVQPKRIAKIVLSDDIKKDLDVGMTEASRWRHDQPSSVNSQVPKSSKLEADLKLIEDFIGKYKSD